MTALDDRMLPRVKAILADVGRAATWTKPLDGGAFDPETLGVDGELSTDYSVTVSPPFPYRSTARGGDVAIAGDATIYVAAQDLAFTPTAFDRVRIDGDTWVVVTFNGLYSGESVAAYEVILRR